jgi:hypothetical protein
LEDGEVERILGSPGAFVAEFRTSAGLDDSEAHASQGFVMRGRARLIEWESRLSDLTRWPLVRPLWIWIRGWLLVSAWSLLYDIEGFSRFPIPSVGNSTLTGLVLVVAATWISLWLDQGRASSRRIVASRLFSIVAGFALLGTLANPYPTHTVEVIDDGIYFDGLTTANGETIDNIFAFDLEGNPVEVLLFDARGRPVQTLPLYVYDDTAYDPGRESFDYGNGTVTFPRDQFGRIIPNLYPLELTVYDDQGRQIPMPPPSLGLPNVDPDEGADETDVVRTTIVTGR